MKKVCHITSAHMQRDIRILIKECVSLSKNYDVHLVVLNGNDEVYNKVTIHSTSYPIKRRLDRFTKGVKAVYKKALEVDADVYHLHDPELLQVAKKLKRRNKIVIFDAHEDLPAQIKGKYWINKYLRGIVAWAAYTYENRTVKKIDAVVTATPFIAERFKGIGKVVANINNYPLLNELESATDWSQKAKEACYIGGATEIRGCTELVEAFDDKLDMTVNFAGNYSPDNYRGQLMLLHGWKYVKEHGFVGRKEVAEILGRSKYGLVMFQAFQNHIEAQPNKMFEYMSAGIPVVTSNFPLWKQIVEGNKCGICVEPKDPAAINKALLYLVQHDAIAQQMGDNGRKAVVEKYNWEQEEIKLLALYQQLLQE
ncbi:MAG: glycosyltransferase family 4 protein [Bacteroidota bacterium]